MPNCVCECMIVHVCVCIGCECVGCRCGGMWMWRGL